MADETERDRIAASEFIVWEKTDGAWQPRCFNSAWAVARAVENGEFHGDIIVTTPQRLTVKGAP